MVDLVATTALETLRDLLIEEAKFLSSVSTQIDEVAEQLKAMHRFLKDADKRQDNSEMVRGWVRDLRKLSIQAENIGKETERIRSRMAELTKQFDALGKEESSADETNWSRKTYGHEIEEHFVGMEEEIKLLETLMKSDDRSNRVISICGMGGKTTLATKVYNGEAAEWCFQARAWICGHSKVLLTTRNKNIAATEYVHELRCMSDDVGWELLQKIALPTNRSQVLTTNEINLLEEVGRKIVRECGRLPLPISVIGGILRHESSMRWWEKVCQTIDSYLQRGCFPEDEDINAEKLYLLWMAEGMVSHEDRGRGETLRDVAERYLSELANRCMVQVRMDEYSICNKFESCRLHDLMRDLCLSKGKEEEFLEVVDRHMGTEEASLICKISRLAIHLDEAGDDYLGKNKNLRSLLFLPVGRRGRGRNNLVSINFRMLKFLKILILEGYNFQDKKIPEEIKGLILLKHLSIERSWIKEFPSSICNLPCLRSLNLDSLGGLKLPNTIHKLRRLSHLSLPHPHRVKGGGKLKLEGLNELETIKWFSSSVDDTTHLLKLPKLQRLQAHICDEESLQMIIDYTSNHQEQFREIKLVIEEGITFEKDGSSILRKMLTIHSLSYLNIRCRVGKLPAYEIESWRNLVTLIVEGCYIEEDPMEVLEKLPMLRELTFWNHAYVGRKMVCSASGFPNLTSLMLSSLGNLEEWRVEERAMPNLFHLSIWDCEKLETIPEGLKFITTLKQLWIGDMPKKFADRARVVDGREGEDYYKIKHIPSINFVQIKNG
ncbi:UNVERIFIED_CONTAM: putative disease resistance protein [Sesamum calycinum]|uniref:Disease resistance protein n=1 Tax=Sesamum calycinum TaxID=2727403 RepID=A0AAW2IXF0_9LAMI